MTSTVVYAIFSHHTGEINMHVKRGISDAAGVYNGAVELLIGYNFIDAKEKAPSDLEAISALFADADQVFECIEL